jgi:hypothetical protein
MCPRGIHGLLTSRPRLTFPNNTYLEVSEGKTRFRLHRKEKKVMGRVWKLARDKVMTPAVLYVVILDVHRKQPIKK